MNTLGNAVPHPPSECQIGDMIVDELSVLWKIKRVDPNSSMVDVQRADNPMRHSRIDLNDLQHVYRPKRMVTHHDPRVGGAWQGNLCRTSVRNDHVAEESDGVRCTRVVRSLNQANRTNIDSDYDYHCRLTMGVMPHSNKKVWIATFAFDDIPHPVVVPMTVRPFERTCVLVGRAAAGDLRITAEMSSVDEDTLHISCWMVREDGTLTHVTSGELHRRARS